MPSRRELPADLVGRLCRADVDERAQPRTAGGPDAAVGAAHRLIDAGATTRRQALAAEVSGACQAERGRAAAYYADAIAGIEARLATAQPDRRAALEQRLRATGEEEARRLAEIAEKYEARHTIRPYRLHVMLVPALRVPADVLRGMRRYPAYFDWLLPAGAYAPTRCPSCGGEAPLVAGKLKLGCETCLPPNRGRGPGGGPGGCPPPRLRPRLRPDRPPPCPVRLGPRGRYPAHREVPGPHPRPGRYRRRPNGGPLSRRRYEGAAEGHRNLGRTAVVRGGGR